MDELKKLLERADFGRLEFIQTDEDYGYIDDDNREKPVADGLSVDCGLAFVAAVNALPELLAERDRLKKQIGEMQVSNALLKNALNRIEWGSGTGETARPLKTHEMQLIAKTALKSAALNQEPTHE